MPVIQRDQHSMPGPCRPGRNEITSGCRRQVTTNILDAEERCMSGRDAERLPNVMIKRSGVEGRTSSWKGLGIVAQSIQTNQYHGSPQHAPWGSCHTPDPMKAHPCHMFRGILSWAAGCHGRTSRTMRLTSSSNSCNWMARWIGAGRKVARPPSGIATSSGRGPWSRKHAA